MTVSEEGLATLLINGPMALDVLDGRRIAKMLKSPDANRLCKFAVLCSMGSSPQEAARLARELEQPTLGVESAGEIERLVKQAAVHRTRQPQAAPGLAL